MSKKIATNGKKVVKKSVAQSKKHDVVKKSPGPAPGTGGRPKKTIDIKKLIRLAKQHCTQLEIAAEFEMDADTVEARIKDYYNDPNMTFSLFLEQNRLKGKKELRQTFWKSITDEKNIIPSLRIFGYKNYLGMSDKIELGEFGENQRLTEMTPEEQESRLNELAAKQLQKDKG